jgi:hypothetical protein
MDSGVFGESPMQNERQHRLGTCTLLLSKAADHDPFRFTGSACSSGRDLFVRGGASVQRPPPREVYSVAHGENGLAADSAMAQRVEGLADVPPRHRQGHARFEPAGCD